MERVVIDDAEFDRLPNLRNEVDFVPPLSAPPSPLIGRESTVRSLIEKIDDADIRLLTLTGAGGIGKTRIALAVAWQLDRPVAFVPLAAIARPDLVAATIAQSIGLEPISNSHAFVTLRDALRDRTLVLMLDNFEHLSQASLLVSDLLAACPKLTVLVTSRSRLAISGECVIPVEPLDLPTGSGLAAVGNSEAVRLFVVRSREVHPEFTLNVNNCDAVARVCTSLDGLPLAIELAAARSNLLSPQALAARLEHRLQLLTDGPNDLPARLQTMRAAIAWSVDLLEPAERQIWQSLAVFSGGCTIEAVEAVIAASEHPDIDPLKLVQSLIDQGLLRQTANSLGEPRFGMLETTRQYAMELLQQDELEQRARNVHAGFFHELCKAIEPGLMGTDTETWQQRTESDIANLRLAIGWLRDQDHIQLAIQCVSRLEWFFTIPNFVAEGRQWCDQLLERVDARVEENWSAQLLDTAGVLADWHRDTERSADYYRRALPIWRRLDDKPMIVGTLMGLGSTSIDSLMFDEADVYAREAYDLAVVAATGWAAGGSANLLGVAAAGRGEFVSSVEWHKTALLTYREAGITAHTRGALNGLGLGLLSLGEYQLAWENYEAVISLSSETDLNAQVPSAIEGFAEIALRNDQPELTARLCAVAATHRKQLGLPSRPHMEQRQISLIDETRAAIGDGRFMLLWTRAQSLSIAESFELARTVQTPVPPIEDGLTRREHEVLRLLVEGTADTEIADRLFISRRTASKHVAAILDKLGAANRTAAATIAYRRGMISIP